LSEPPPLAPPSSPGEAADAIVLVRCTVL